MTLRLEDTIGATAEWTSVATAVNAVATASRAASNSNQAHYVTGLTVSMSAAPAAATNLQLKDGATVLDQFELPAVFSPPLRIDFRRPVRCTPGNTASLVLGALGAGVSGTATLRGYSRLVGGSTPHVWTPLDFGASLMGWYKATSLALDTGARVRQWDDLSGNRRHFVQEDPTKQPIYVREAQNKQSVIRFDGVSQFLTYGTGASVLFGAQPVTAFAALKYSKNTNNDYPFAGSVDHYDFAVNQGGSIYRMYNGTNLLYGSIDLNWHQHTNSFNGASSYARLDGTQTNGDAGAGGESAPYFLAVRSPGNSGFTQMDWGEFFIVKGTGLSDQATAEAYLKNSWATP